MSESDFAPRVRGSNARRRVGCLVGLAFAACAHEPPPRGSSGGGEGVCGGAAVASAVEAPPVLRCEGTTTDAIDETIIGLTGLGRLHVSPAEVADALKVVADAHAEAATVAVGAAAGSDSPGLVIASVAGADPCGRLGLSDVMSSAAGRQLAIVHWSPGAWAAMTCGRQRERAQQMPEARAGFATADRIAMQLIAAPLLSVAATYAAEGRVAEARGVYTEVSARCPADPAAHLGLGDALRAEGRRGEAADAWSRAIALAPGDGAVLTRIAADPFVAVAPAVAPPALREPSGTWRLVRRRAAAEAPETVAARVAEANAYARCKETFRSSPKLRASLVGVANESSWRWSPLEEAVCTAAWLGAYQKNRDAGRIEDGALDDLLLIAKDGCLGERALYDVGAQAHPLAPGLLDAKARQQLFDFVAAHRVMRRKSGGFWF